MSDFESRMLEAASKYSTERWGPVDNNHEYPGLLDECFIAFKRGAQLARKETIAEVLGLLSSESAKQTAAEHHGDRGLAPMFWKLWLEERLNKIAP